MSADRLDLRSARADAARVARLADVEISHPTTMAELEAAAGLFVDIWSTRVDDPPIPAETMRALTHVGAYVAGAYRGERLVGAAVAFFGPPDTRSLHSHITGIDPTVQSRNIGFALKLEQRAWAVERGLTEITWTFDPLIARNAYFNLAKLGAGVTAYLTDFYGEMRDGLNAGQGSDRLFVRWDVAAPLPDAVERARELPEGVQILLDEDASGAPVRRNAVGPVLACRIPEDIAALRTHAPAVARAWRHAVRDTLGEAVSHGYAVHATTRSGWYVLRERPVSDSAAPTRRRNATA